jgi:hypothetical protein
LTLNPTLIILIARQERRLKVSDVRLYEKKIGRLVEPPIKMRDMSKDMQWLAEHREEYAGKWVAVYLNRERMLHP